MEWRELRSLVDREAVEAVSELFARHAYGGVVVEEAIVPDHGGDGYAVDLGRPVVVKAYLPLDAESTVKESAIAESLWHLSQMRAVGPLRVETVDEEDWANAWKAHYEVHRVGKRIIIKPSWQEYQPKRGEIIVALDPGMAFGTGLHPTTQMCLRALERYVVRGMHVLDVGTGSGILAIAAVKLGASSVVALDLDSVAIDAARENVVRNGLDAKIDIRLGTVGQAEKSEYDLVIANITARVIASLAQPLASAVRPAGFLLLSGIIAGQLGPTRRAVERAEMRIVARRHAGDWRALIASH